MSFVYRSGSSSEHKKNKNKKKKTTLLRMAVRRHVKERTLFLSRRVKAGITIEAALALPLFIFFSSFLMTFLMIFSLQVDIQAGLDDASRSLDRKAYLAQKTKTDEMAVNTATIPIAFFGDDMKARIDGSNIKGGTSGMSMLLSSYDHESGILDVVINYDYEIPFLPEAISSVHLAQRTRSRAWIGRPLDDAGDNGKESGEDDDDRQTVYITETGSVYHTSKSCHYLDLSIKQTSYSDVDALRNKNGAKYYRCPLCAKSGTQGGAVYITDYGDNWHTSLSCSGLKRTIIEKDISEIGDMPLCSKCGGSH